MKTIGDGRRVRKVEREVQTIISSYVINGLRNEVPGILTVTRVHMSADLKQARVHVSCMNDKVDWDLMIEVLGEHSFKIQHQLAKELSLRYTPKIKFFADKSAAQVEHINKTLSDLSLNSSDGSDSNTAEESE